MDEYIRDNGIDDTQQNDVMRTAYNGDTSQQPKKDNKMTRRRFWIYVLILGVIAAICFMGAIKGFTAGTTDLETGIHDLKEGDVLEGTPAYGDNEYCLKYTHFINVIPVFREYYYSIYSKDIDRIVIVRAGKNFGDSFNNDAEYVGKDPIKGKVKTFDVDVQKKIREAIDDATYLSDYGITVNDTLYIDLLGTRMNYMLLFIGIINVIIIAIMFNLFKQTETGMGFDTDNPFNKVLAGIAGVGLCVACYLLVVVLHMV